MLSTASVTMMDFGVVVLDLARNRFRWRSQHFLDLGLSTIMFCGITFYLGTVEGSRDKSETHSLMPQVTFNDKPSEYWRLVVLGSDTIYLWKTEKVGSVVRAVSGDTLNKITITEPIRLNIDEKSPKPKER